MYEPSIQSEFSIEEILNDKIVDGQIHYLVKWKGFSLKQSSWQPSDHLKNAPDHIQLWKEKKKKLQKLDKTPKKKKLQKDQFEGEKYIKKSSFKAQNNPKRETRKKKNKNNLSQIQINPGATNAAKCDSDKSCNSETTSYRGKDRKRKNSVSKDPIESILESLKKIKESKSISAEHTPKSIVNISQQITTKKHSKKSTKNLKLQKKNCQQLNEDTQKERYTKINALKKLTNASNSEQARINLSKCPQKQLPKKVQNQNLSEYPVCQSKQNTKNSSQKQDKNPQQEMFSIRKKDLLALIKESESLKQSEISSSPLQAPNVLEKPENLAALHPQKTIQKKLANLRIQNASVPQPQKSLADKYQQIYANQTAGKPLVRSFVSHSKQFMRQASSQGGLGIRSMGKVNYENKDFYQRPVNPLSKQFLLNYSFDQKDNFRNQNLVKDAAKQQKNSSNIRPAIYDEMEKQREKESKPKQNYKDYSRSFSKYDSRQRQRYRGTSRQRKRKHRDDSFQRSRDESKRKNNKKDKNDKKERKSQGKSRNRKNSREKDKRYRRSSRSRSSQRDNRRKKRKRKNSSSSYSSGRSSSPIFSEPNDDDSSYVEQKSKQNQSKPNKQKNRKDSMIEIPSSSSSVAMIDQEQFANRTSKRFALNQEYYKRYKIYPNAKQSEKKFITNERHDNLLAKQSQNTILKAKNLHNFLVNHPTKWWEKDMKTYIRQIKKSIKEELKNKQGYQIQNVKKMINISQSFNQSQENWTSPFDANRPSVKVQPNSKMPCNPRSSSNIHDEQSYSTKSTHCQNSSKQDLECFEPLVCDIIEWFKDSYPDEEITPQIKNEILDIVRKMVDQDMGDDLVQKWMEDYGRKKQQKEKNQKKDQKSISEKPKSNSKEINKNNRNSLDLDKSKISIQEGAKSLDYITSFFRPRNKKVVQNIIQLENDNGQTANQEIKSLSTNLSSTNLVSKAQSNINPTFVKRQVFSTQLKQNLSFSVKEDPKKLIDKDNPKNNLSNSKQKLYKPSQHQNRQTSTNTNALKAPSYKNTQNLCAKQKAKKMVESNNIIKILTDFEYKGQKCYKILLNSGIQVNAHEADVKKNCSKLLLEYYQRKIQTYENEKKRK